MARRGRPPKAKVTEEEIKETGIKEDYYSDRRSSNGYIKISLNSAGAGLLNKSVDDEIEEKQRELTVLRERRKELETLGEKIKKKDKKRKKRDKKKKKKEKKKLKALPESSRILLGAIEEYKDKFHSKPKKKGKKDQFEGVSSRPKGGGRQKTKEDEEEAQRRKEEREKKEFDKKFEEPITLFRQTIVDVDKALQEVDALIKETKESRARNRATLLKDLLSAKSNLFNNRTSNARHIGDMQKIRTELELRKVKEKGANVDEKNQNIALIAKAFPQLIAGNKLGGPTLSLSNKDGDKKDRKKDKKRKKNSIYEEKFIERASSLIKSGDIELTPHEAAIDMEGQYTIAVKKSFKDHDWEFIAIDNNGQEIRGFKDKYPGLLPKKKHHHLRFDDERDVCKCTRTDQVYQVIPVPHI